MKASSGDERTARAGVFFFNMGRKREDALFLNLLLFKTKTKKVGQR